MRKNDYSQNSKRTKSKSQKKVRRKKTFLITLLRETKSVILKITAHIYDQTGKLVKALNANESGRSELNAYNLAAGTYTYTLMVNGKVALSKQMLIIK